MKLLLFSFIRKILIITILLILFNTIDKEELHAEIAKKEEIYKILLSENPKNALPLLVNLFDRLDLSIDMINKDFIGNRGSFDGVYISSRQSYIMQAYADMYEVTGNMKYLDKLYLHIVSVINNRDDNRGKSSIPCWRTDYISRGVKWEHYVLHTAMIAYPMLEFVYIVKKYNIKKYLPKAEFILERVEESVNYHNKDFKKHKDGSYGYLNPSNPQGNVLGPLNEQGAIGRCLVLLSVLTGKNEYKQKKMKLARVIKSAFIPTTGGGYIWKYNPFVGDDETIEDISHGTFTSDFIRLCYENDVIFTEDDMKKIAYTISSIAHQGHFPKYIDGKGGYVYGYERGAGMWIFFAEFDKKIYREIVKLYWRNYDVEHLVRIGQSYTGGGEVDVMLSISRLIKYLYAKWR